jgi:hypothetical protein
VRYDEETVHIRLGDPELCSTDTVSTKSRGRSMQNAVTTAKTCTVLHFLLI